MPWLLLVCVCSCKMTGVGGALGRSGTKGSLLLNTGNWKRISSASSPRGSALATQRGRRRPLRPERPGFWKAQVFPPASYQLVKPDAVSTLRFSSAYNSCPARGSGRAGAAVLGSQQGSRDIRQGGQEATSVPAFSLCPGLGGSP